MRSLFAFLIPFALVLTGVIAPVGSKALAVEAWPGQAQADTPGVLPPESLPDDVVPPSVDDLDAPTTDAEPPDEPGPAIPGPLDTADELTTLFARLVDAGTAEKARPVIARIQVLWLHSGSATVDLLMARAGAAMKAQDYALALDLMDMVVRLAPEFAEGWNRRATVHYLREDFGRSLVDIERVLALEPRHWGAISGLGIILRRLGRERAALAAFEEVLRIHPASENARKAVKELAARTAGSDT